MSLYRKLFPALVLTIALSCVPSNATVTFGNMRRTVRADTGSNVTLTCPINTSNQVFAMWHMYTDGELVVAAQGTTVSEAYRNRMSVAMEVGGQGASYSLTIRNVEASDSGLYYCSAFNNAGAARSPKIRLRVGDVVDSVQMSGTRYVDLGGALHVTCVMPSGVDNPVTWFRNGDWLTQRSLGSRGVIHHWEGQANTSGTGSTININEARMEDAGTYVCRSFGGNNIRGSLISSFQVSVLTTANSNSIRRGH